MYVYLYIFLFYLYYIYSLFSNCSVLLNSLAYISISCHSENNVNFVLKTVNYLSLNVQCTMDNSIRIPSQTWPLFAHVMAVWSVSMTWCLKTCIHVNVSVCCWSRLPEGGGLLTDSEQTNRSEWLGECGEGQRTAAHSVKGDKPLPLWAQQQRKIRLRHGKLMSA